ncbi:MAG: sigma-54 dependent transcriptional regulator [Planctomycetales bacterium]
MSRILVIDDDRAILHLIRHGLEPMGIEVVTATSAAEGLSLVSEKIDVVLLDIMLPRMSGMEVFQRIHEMDRRLPVIFITAGAGSETAIEAMQLGAYDYLAKPIDLPQLTGLITKALETRRLMQTPVAVSVNKDEENRNLGDLFIGRSPPMLEVFKAIGQVAKQNITVLIRGESGTGKELVARALYQFSDRANRPFMAVNCAALPDTLLESELFGHEKGSFTGADRRRIGKFEQCSGGTLFLDEVGDMSPLVQGKVLRLLQEQRFERVGGNETITTDVRMIAATNRPLDQMVERGEFRPDLYYRLNVVTISLPPLRQREGDIPLLLEYFLTQIRKELKKPELEGISPEALKILLNYPWPGNIRELQSVVRQFVIKSSGPVIVPDFLPPAVRSGKGTVPQYAPSPHAVESPAAIEEEQDQEVVSQNGASHSPNGESDAHDLAAFIGSRLNCQSTNLYAEALEMMERYLFVRVLQETGGNQSKAAEILGITRGKVRDRIAAFKILLDKTISLNP